MKKLTYGTPQEAGMDPERIRRLQARAPELVDGFRARSAVMLAARRGKIFFHEAYGPLTDKPGSPPMQKDSVFAVSSITKPIAATTLLMLVEDGRLGLNRPVKEYLPEICGEGTDDIEVQHLLNHTSGYSEEACWAHYGKVFQSHLALSGDPGAGLSDDMARYLPCLWDKPVDFKPAGGMDYCSHNFALIIEIVRRICGQSAEGFAKDRIFNPLGMVDTTCFRDEAKSDRQVIRGEGVPFGSVAGYPEAGHEGAWLRSSYWGYMGLNSTALDLAAFGQMFLNKGRYDTKRVLSRPAVHEMTRSQTSGLAMSIMGHTGEVASYGLGWFVQDKVRWTWVGGSLIPQGTFSHSGAGGHMLWVDRGNEIVGVYLSVCLDIDLDVHQQRTQTGLFQDMVTAAAVD